MVRGKSTGSPPYDIHKAVSNKGKGIDDTDQASASEIEKDDHIEGVPKKGTDTASTSSSTSNLQIIIETKEKVMEQLKKKRERLASEQDQALTECCVYRVHESIRKVKPQAYTPQLISIGPLHRGNKRLKDMEKQKLRYFEQLFQPNNPNKLKLENIRNLVSSIQKKEVYIRACYSERFTKIKSCDFVEMILLDAVFIIEFLKDSNDDRHLSPWMIFCIREDLMLLENQLPFFIIEQIYDEINAARRTIEDGQAVEDVDGDGQAVEDVNHGRDGQDIGQDDNHARDGQAIEDINHARDRQAVEDVNHGRDGQEVDQDDHHAHDGQAVEDVNHARNRQAVEDVNRTCQKTESSITFLKLATVHFAKYTSTQGAECNPPIKGRTFTDLLRNFMLNGALEKSTDFSHPTKLKYSAFMLSKAGVNFLVSPDKCLVNITFENGVLKIPRLEIDDSFERFVRNLMVLEQCHQPFQAYICNYFKFMDHLINGPEDVDLLVKEKIILNWLGDNAAVSNLINNLSQQISETGTCYNETCERMNKHYENKWNHRRATLKLVYFSNLWRGTGTIAAAILLILTLIQTIATVMSLFKQ